MKPLTIAQLRAVANRYGIPVRSRARKAEILSTVRDGLKYDTVKESAARFSVSAGGRKEVVAYRTLEPAKKDNWTVKRLEKQAARSGVKRTGRKRDIIKRLNDAVQTGKTMVGKEARRIESKPLKSEFRAIGDSVEAAIKAAEQGISETPGLVGRRGTLVSVVVEDKPYTVPAEVYQGGAKAVASFLLDKGVRPTGDGSPVEVRILEMTDEGPKYKTNATDK